MEQTVPRVRRRIFMIDPSMQRDFVLRAVLVLLVFSGVIVTSILFTLNRLHALPVTPATMDAIEMTTWTTGFVFLLSLASVTMYFVFLTHKIAGPAYRLKRQLADLGVGNYETPVGLREGDYLKDLAAWIDKLRTDLAARRERLQTVTTRAEVLRDLITRGEGSGAKARELLDSIMNDLKAAVIEGPRVDSTVIRREDRA